MGAEAAQGTSASAWTLQRQWQLHQFLPALPPPTFFISLLCADLSGRPIQLLGCFVNRLEENNLALKMVVFFPSLDQCLDRVHSAAEWEGWKAPGLSPTRGTAGVAMP